MFIPDQGLTAPTTGWPGINLKELLQKIDIGNVDKDGDDNVKWEKSVANAKQTPKAPVSASNPESAYLGPRLCDDKTISLDDFSIEDLLNEDLAKDNKEDHDSKRMDLVEEIIQLTEMEARQNESQSTPVQSPHSAPPRSDGQKQRQNVIPKETGASFLYTESKRARMERERDERRKRQIQREKDQIDNSMQVEEETKFDPHHVKFAPEELALATVPGLEFDPRRMAFNPDELKPQPIVMKKKKQFVSSNEKDSRYWEKRLKNNVAARRSREARRLKENQIALRASFLERENAILREQMMIAQANNCRLNRESKDLWEKVKILERRIEKFNQREH